MVIRIATEEDVEILNEYDKHITKEELLNAVRLKRVIISVDVSRIIGWLRYNLFWDNTPFLNMLFVLEEARGRGVGTALVSFWEEEMGRMKYGGVLTSTQSDENGQFFYRKRGYRDIGAFVLPGEVSELMFYKELK